MIKPRREGADWFLSEYWRRKDNPTEQLDFQIGNQGITLYNYNKEKPFTPLHEELAAKTFQELAS